MSSLKHKIHQTIFENDTRAGKAFDVVLLFMIITSVFVVIIESIPEIQNKYADYFHGIELFFTIIFSLEYLLRLYSVKKPIYYMRSFYGVIDLLAILPTYLSYFIYGTQYFLVIRSLRLLRVFRIFKLAHFVNEGHAITRALKASSKKISVFLVFVLILVTIMGALMYAIEGKTNPSMSSIPRGIYWAIVTVTTVGFGDITPITSLGRFVSTVLMIIGYSVIAVPTGIISVGLINQVPRKNTQVCPNCSFDSHDDDALFCKKCGSVLNEF